MIPYKQLTDISLGPISIKVWGLIVAIGITTALILALRKAKKTGIKQAWIYDLTFYSILSGLIGSRIGYVLFSWPANEPLTLISAIDITKGGLAFTFGFLAAAIATITYAKLKKIKLLRFADFIIPYVVLAHAIGRIGCFLIGDHLGKTTSFILGVMADGAVRHNVALYEVMILFLIFAILTCLKRFKTFDGFMLASYMMLYPLLRFPLDFLRVDPTYHGLTAAQYILIGLFAMATLFILMNALKRR